eukprot:3379107-Amphidinium_carterae.2
MRRLRLSAPHWRDSRCCHSDHDPSRSCRYPSCGCAAKPLKMEKSSAGTGVHHDQLRGRERTDEHEMDLWGNGCLKEWGHNYGTVLEGSTNRDVVPVRQ